SKSRNMRLLDPGLISGSQTKRTDRIACVLAGILIEVRYMRGIGLDVITPPYLRSAIDRVLSARKLNLIPAWHKIQAEDPRSVAWRLWNDRWLPAGSEARFVGAEDRSNRDDDDATDNRDNDDDDDDDDDAETFPDPIPTAARGPDKGKRKAVDDGASEAEGPGRSTSHRPTKRRASRKFQSAAVVQSDDDDEPPHATPQLPRAALNPTPQPQSRVDSAEEGEDGKPPCKYCRDRNLPGCKAGDGPTSRACKACRKSKRKCTLVAKKKAVYLDASATPAPAPSGSVAATPARSSVVRPAPEAGSSKATAEANPTLRKKAKKATAEKADPPRGVKTAAVNGPSKPGPEKTAPPRPTPKLRPFVLLPKRKSDGAAFARSFAPPVAPPPGRDSPASDGLDVPAASDGLEVPAAATSAASSAANANANDNDTPAASSSIRAAPPRIMATVSVQAAPAAIVTTAYDLTALRQRCDELEAMVRSIAEVSQANAARLTAVEPRVQGLEGMAESLQAAGSLPPTEAVDSTPHAV
ncbi:hypothetical protein BJ138DRAFT_1107619, partial [Hygrophoropsis aurantiaca]